MRMVLFVLLLMPSCSMSEGQKPENSALHVPTKSETAQVQEVSGEATVERAANTKGAVAAQLPYLAVRKTSGPALQALMSGRLEVQGDCIVFVEPGAAPKLAVFHPPASLKRGSDGGIVVAGLNFEIPIGREVRVGGGALPPGDDPSATLRTPVANGCPAKAVEIGELVR